MFLSYPPLYVYYVGLVSCKFSVSHYNVTKLRNTWYKNKLNYVLDLQTWPRYCQNESACQLTLLEVKKLNACPKSELHYYYSCYCADIVSYVSPVVNGYSDIYVVRTTYVGIPLTLGRLCPFTSKRVNKSKVICLDTHTINCSTWPTKVVGNKVRKPTKDWNIQYWSLHVDPRTSSAVKDKERIYSSILLWWPWLVSSEYAEKTGTPLHSSRPRWPSNWRSVIGRSSAISTVCVRPRTLCEFCVTYTTTLSDSVCITVCVCMIA